MDVRGLALAHGLGYVVGCLVAWRILTRELDGFGDRAFWREMLKITVAAAMAAVVMLAAYLWLDVAFGGDLAAVTQLLVGGVAGIAMFVGAAKVLGVDELDTLGRLLPARVRTRLGIPG
jgi:peptidoglycan biosynthesis protein MviN/MurJ (putative lipid II flippase)